MIPGLFFHAIYSGMRGFVICVYVRVQELFKTMKYFVAVMLLLAVFVLVVPSMACPGPIEDCYCGNYGLWKIGYCGSHDDCCQQIFFMHRHGERICPPEPKQAAADQSTGFYAFTAGPCSIPARVITLSEKDGRTYMIQASYMGFIDNLTISTYYVVGDSDIPYYQLNPFVSSTSGIGVVSLSSGGAVARSFEYAAIKDETSTPAGWQIRGELVDMSTGIVVDIQSTNGSDTCLHVLYNFSPSPGWVR